MVKNRELPLLQPSKALAPWRELKKQLEKDVQEIPEDLFTSQDFKREVQARLKSLECFRDEKLTLFQSKGAFWCSALDQLLYLVELFEHLQALKDGEEDESDWEDQGPPTEEELFDFWNESSYAESFSELISEGDSPFAASYELQPLYEQQILAFYDLHLDSKPTVEKSEGPFLYIAGPELGENPNQLILGPQGHVFHPPEPFEEFPQIYLYFYNTKDAVICYEHGNTQRSLKSLGTGLKACFPTHEQNLNLFEAFDSPEKHEDFSLTSWKGELEQALNIISQTSPRCAEAVGNLTNTIVAMDQPGIVSYSVKELPGISHINAIERDFVDLMDDIVHENGHHYLNHHLFSEDLIYEDDEKIFYSAWREALRPIRGLYHAYCTFCWAHFLFSDLTEALLAGKELKLNDNQKTKIYRRLLEENTMLKCSEWEMERAYSLGKISDAGFDLYKTFQDQILKNQNTVDQAKQKLTEKDASALEKIEVLEKSLKENMGSA